MRGTAFITESSTWCKRCTTVVAKSIRLLGYSFRLRIDSSESVVYSAAHHTADHTANTAYHSETDTHIGKLTDRFVACDCLGNIKATLLLIGVALLGTLGSLCLRINDGFLCFGLRIDDIRLLAKLCFCNIGILAEMQFLEFYVLLIIIGFYYCGYKESVERNAV